MLQVAPNPPPPILEIVRENPTTAEYKTIEPNFIDSYHSPDFCFEQANPSASYLINNDGKY